MRKSLLSPMIACNLDGIAKQGPLISSFVWSHNLVYKQTLVVSRNMNLEQHSTGTENHSSQLILMVEPWRDYPFIPETQGQMHRLAPSRVTQDLVLRRSYIWFNVLLLLTGKSQFLNKEPCTFYFSLGLANCVTDPALLVPWYYHVSALLEAYLVFGFPFVSVSWCIYLK